MRPELDAARPQVGAGLRPGGILDLAADMTQQAAQQRLVDRLVARRLLVLLPAMFGAKRMKLGMDIPPLAQPQPRHEVLPAPRFLLAAGFVPEHFVPGPPGMQEPQELGLLIDLSAAKARMCLVRGALALRRTLACILGRQRAGDDEHLAEAAALAGSDDHATDLRVERQLGKLAADRGQLQGVVDRAEFGKQLVAVGDHLRLRRVDEGEVLDFTEPQRLHAQDHARQRRAQDLRIRMGRAPVEIVLVVEAEAHPVHDPAAAAGTLFAADWAIFSTCNCSTLLRCEWRLTRASPVSTT